MSSFTPAPAQPSPQPTVARPLAEGPRWYRARIRGWGPFVALILPAVVGAIAYGALYYSDATWSGAVGLVGALLAAPGLLLVGAPFGDRGLYPLAIGGSALLWMFVGWTASRRATRNPMATWGLYWTHYLWMLGGIWVGVVGALAIATASLGDSLL